MTGKQTCFTKKPRELCMPRPVFNATWYANIIILVNKLFVPGLSSFGYDCYKIAGSCSSLEKTLVQWLILEVINKLENPPKWLFTSIFFLSEREVPDFLHTAFNLIT